MKKLLIPFIVILFFSCNQQPSSQQTTDTAKKQTDITTIKSTDTAKPVAADIDTITDPIARIKQRVEFINTTQTEKKHFEFMCDEQTKLDYFYINGELVKISVDFGTVGDVYAKEDYYYNKGQLLFKYEFVEGGPACDDCIRTDEYRSYINNGEVIKYLKNKATAPCRTCRFEPRAKENKLYKATTTEEIKAILCR